MADFLDFVRVTERDGPRRLTYVVGDEPVLREEVIDAVRLTVDAEQRDTESLSAAEDGPARVWTAMSQHAADPTRRRLVVVRDAERLRLDRLAAWLSGANLAKVHVVMSDQRRDWPADRDPEARAKLVKSSMGILVDASLPRGSREAKAAKIACEAWSTNLSAEAATHLARRTNADLARMRDFCRAANVLRVPAEPRVIDALVSEDPGTNYAEALARLDRATAVRSARHVTSTRQAINRTAQLLGDAELLNASLRPVLSRYGEPGQVRFAIREAASVTGLPVPRVSLLWHSAKLYDANAVRKRTDALVRADSHRDDPGVLETLATEW